MKKNFTYLQKCISAIGCVLLASGFLLGAAFASPPKSQSEILWVAHRAGAAHGPENTLTALEETIRQGSVMAEIDVRQLGDGTLVLLHDDNLYRTQGIALSAADATADDLHGLSTFEEALICAKGRIKLMADVKTGENEQGMAKQILSLLQATDMEDQCMIASFDKDFLSYFHQLAPSVPTVYIASVLTEADYDMPCAQAYSLDLGHLSSSVVTRIHAMGKPVYCWTVNTKQDSRFAVGMSVDGIITDDIELSKTWDK
jgi:glycerophosphoryl diester phosphodiesterase